MSLFFIVIVFGECNSLILKKRSQEKENRKLGGIFGFLFTVFIIYLILKLLSKFYKWLHKKNSKRRSLRLLSKEPLSEKHFSHKEARTLKHKFEKMIRKKAKIKLKGVRNYTDLLSHNIKDKIFKAYESLPENFGSKKKDRKLFNKEYPRIVRFLRERSNGDQSMSFINMASLSNQYLKKYYNFSLVKHMDLVGDTVKHLMQNVPIIIGNLK